MKKPLTTFWSLAPQDSIPTDLFTKEVSGGRNSTYTYLPRKLRHSKLWFANSTTTASNTSGVAILINC